MRHLSSEGKTPSIGLYSDLKAMREAETATNYEPKGLILTLPEWPLAGFMV